MSPIDHTPSTPVALCAALLPYLVVQMVQQSHHGQVKVEPVGSNFGNSSLSTCFQGTTLKEQSKGNANERTDQGGVGVHSSAAKRLSHSPATHQRHTLCQLEGSTTSKTTHSQCSASHMQ